MSDYKRITEKDFETVDDYIPEVVDKFGNFIKENPKNTQLPLVLTKIAALDSIYSTNLRTARTDFSLNDIAQFILSLQFDKRVKGEDPKLVEEIANFGKEKGHSIMSFASKYCFVHNYYAYGKDDYSIDDSVVRKSLKEFSDYNFPKGEYKNTRTISGCLEKCHKENNYSHFQKIIDHVIKLQELENVPNIRRKLDLFLWSNRKK